MTQENIGTTEIEATLNSHANIRDAAARSFARNDDGTIEVTLTLAPQEGASREEIRAARETVREAANTGEDERDADPETPENEGLWVCECGSTFDTRDEHATHCGQASGPGHALAERGDSAAEGAQTPENEGSHGGVDAPANPSDRPGYIRANGPCIAASGPNSPENPCGGGAREEGARMCAMHANVAEPTLADDAILARDAWESGDSEVVEAFIEAYA